MYPIAVLLCPLLWAFNQANGGNMGAAVWTVLTIQMILRRTGDLASTCVLLANVLIVLIVAGSFDTVVLDTIPGPEHLAQANSLTFSVGVGHFPYRAELSD